MNKEISLFFQEADQVLFALIDQIEPIPALEKSDQLFSSLCREIVGQQLSTKVARVIFDRFKKLFPDEIITPEFLLTLPDETIRNCGLSWSKIYSIKDLALHLVDKHLVFETFDTLSDQEVIAVLTQVRGIGLWTAEMFLIFSLARTDVFSYGDLGLKNAIKRIYGYDDIKAPEVLALTEKWSPYRSYACMILWRSLAI